MAGGSRQRAVTRKHALNVRPENGGNPAPRPLQIRACFAKSLPFCPHLPSPMANSVCSRCRMDRERFDAGGRECPGGGVLTWGGTSGEAVASVVPLAACFPSGSHKPATGPGCRFLPATCRRGGINGPGLWRICLRERAGSVPEPAPKAAPAVRPGRGRGNPGERALKRGRRQRQPPRDLRGFRLSDGDAIRRIPGRALSAPPIYLLPRGTARARPSGPEFHSHPGGPVAREGFWLAPNSRSSGATAGPNQALSSRFVILGPGPEDPSRDGSQWFARRWGSVWILGSEAEDDDGERRVRPWRVRRVEKRDFLCSSSDRHQPVPEMSPFTARRNPAPACRYRAGPGSSA